jgi:hypothetical protein
MRIFTKFLFLMLLQIVVINTIVGQGFIPTVCSQGLGTNTYTINSIATANATSRLAAIYPASQIATLAGSNLTNFYLNRISTTGAMNTTNLKIYFKTTTAADLGTVAPTWATEIAAATLVYSGNPATIVGTTAGWKNFPLIAPFAYSGNNLIVYLEYTQTTAQAASITWNYEYGTPCISTTNSNTTKYVTTTTGVLGTTLSSTNYRRPAIAFDYATSACSGTPSGGTGTVNTAAYCSGTAVNFSVTGGASGTGLTYLWEYSANNTTYAAASGTNTTAGYSIASASATNAGYYRRTTTCAISGLSATSTPVQITQNTNISSCYCANAATNSVDDDIARVTFGSMANPATAPSPLSSNAAATGTYTNFTALTASNFTQGLAYPISVQAFFSGATTYQTWASVYIDYNQNGLFDTGELAFSQNNPNTTPFTTSGTVTIPVTALTGNTRMRVILVESGTAAQAACTSFTYGEVEDYTINIVAAPVCSGTPIAGTAAASTTQACSGGTTSLSLTGATSGVSGLTYQWESSVAAAAYTAISGATSATYVATPSTTTNYRCAVTCNSGTPAASTPVNVIFTNCNFAVTYNTAAAYSSIAVSGTSATWQSATNGDDNTTNNIPIGFSFFYKGQTYTNVRGSTNGWLSFNPTTSTAYTNDLTSTSAPGNTLAPLWDDLVATGGTGTLPGGLLGSIKYTTTGTSPNRKFIAEWIGMEQFQHAGPNLNFQVVLNETTNIIEYNYGTMEGFNGTVDKGYTYSIGYNAGTTTDYYALQVARSNNFLVTNTANLADVPLCNSSYVFTPAATNSSGTAPVVSAPINDDASGALILTVNPTPCTAYCGTYYTSKNATASAQAVCGGTADDDVWFSFIATTDGAKVSVLGSYGYKARVQLLNSAFTSLNCAVATGTGLAVTFDNSTLTIGDTYYVRVYDDGTGFGTGATYPLTGAFSICVSEIIPPPVNDDCAGAINLTPTTTCVTTSGNTIVATASTVTPTTTCNTPDDDIWYKFTPTIASPVINVQSGAGFNAAMQVFSGTCASLTSLSCINNSSTAGLETYTASGLTPGTPYYVRVFHAVTGAGTGNFTICNVEAPPACPVYSTPANAATNVALSGSLNWASSVNASGYSVYLGTDQNLVTNSDPSVLLGTTTTALTYSTAGLIPLTVYYWKVVASNTIGPSTSCTVFSFTTTPPPPANDDPCNATDLVLGTQICQNTSSATVSTIETGSNLATIYTLSTLNNTVWFKYTPTTTGAFYLNTSSPSASTQVMQTWAGIYTTDCTVSPLVFTQVMAPVSSSATAGVATVTTTPVLTAGTTYHFMIDGVSGSFGDFCIQLSPKCNASVGLSAITATGTTQLTTVCNDMGNNYTYYGIPNGAGTQYYLAINWAPDGTLSTANAVAKLVAMPNITLNPTYDQNVGATQTVYAMKRYWNVENVGLFDEAVNVKFFYDAAEKAEIDGISGATTFTWFKTVGTPYTGIGNMNNGFITNAIPLTATLGTENGTTYAGFTGVNNFSGGTYAASSTSLSPLPIVLKSFAATEKGAANTINWETAVEINVRHFVIEKSTDAKNWISLEVVYSNASKRYTLNDNTPFSTTYYRLKNIDNDGQESSSNVVVVNRKTGKFTITSLAPNPTTSDMNLKFETTENTNISITVSDIFGRVLLSQNSEAIKGFNTVNLMTSEVPAGAYFLNVNDGVNTLIQRIVKN